MAADWIKMRVDLRDDPDVVKISEDLGINQDEVVGKLHRIWSWADTHAKGGLAEGISENWMDKYVGKRGFSRAMAVVDWLEIADYGIKFPHFDRHNGDSAKRRSTDALRKRVSRERPQDVREMSAKCPDKIVTREEKRREEKSEERLTADAVGKTPSPKPARKEATGPHAIAMKAYSDAWLDRYDVKPVITSRDGKAAKELLVAFGVDVNGLCQSIRAYVADDDPWLVKQKHPLHHLTSRVNAYRGSDPEEKLDPWGNPLPPELTAEEALAKRKLENPEWFDADGNNVQLLEMLRAAKALAQNGDRESIEGEIEEIVSGLRKQGSSYVLPEKWEARKVELRAQLHYGDPMPKARSF